MQFFLDKATEHLGKGLDEQKKGNREQARQHYLKAAEFLFKAAQYSTGDLRRQRIEKAEELLQRAKTLEVVPARPSAAAKPGEPAAAAAAGEDTPWLVAERPTTRFDNVAGLDNVKEQIRLRMVYPFTHPKAAERYGTKRGGGLLLYGPPGTGKTLLARAVAGEIEAAFFTVKASDIMSKWVGEAEQNIAKLFATARSYERAIIFIDEVESLVPRRRDSHSTVMQRVVPQILTEMEGFQEHKESTLMFIGATNEPWSLDPAVMRPGRFDERVYIPLPDHPARQRIIELNLKGKPIAADVQPPELAELMDGYSGADIVHICRRACDIPFIEAVKTGIERDITVADFLTVMQTIKPSVDKKDLARFEQFAKGE
jgi:transitional endoplasmic reticulum ATPase